MGNTIYSLSIKCQPLRFRKIIVRRFSYTRVFFVSGKVWYGEGRSTSEIIENYWIKEDLHLLCLLFEWPNVSQTHAPRVSNYYRGITYLGLHQNIKTTFLSLNCKCRYVCLSLYLYWRHFLPFWVIKVNGMYTKHFDSFESIEI